MKSYGYFLLLLSLLTLATPVLVSAEELPIAKGTVVPFETLPSGHIAVQVMVNGKGPYRLIFDTGAPISLLSTKLARESGILKNMPRPAIALFGNMGEARIEVLKVGNQEARDISAIVMDHPTLEAIARVFGPLEGIIGFPFFARFKMTLDYQAKTMTLAPSGFKPPDVMKAMMAAIMNLGDPEPRYLAPAALWGFHADNSGDEEAGVTVKKVMNGSPAARAGLKAGDRLLTLDDRWTDTTQDLYAAASLIKPGTTVAVKVKRDGKEIILNMKPVQGL